MGQHRARCWQRGRTPQNRSTYSACRCWTARLLLVFHQLYQILNLLTDRLKRGSHQRVLLAVRHSIASLATECEMTNSQSMLLNEHQAARQLGLKVTTLRRWRWSGRRSELHQDRRSCSIRPDRPAKVYRSRSPVFYLGSWNRGVRGMTQEKETSTGRGWAVKTKTKRHTIT